MRAEMRVDLHEKYSVMKLPCFILHGNLVHGLEAVIFVFGPMGEHHTGMVKLTGVFFILATLNRKYAKSSAIYSPD
jgi:hypothetical protein